MTFKVLIKGFKYIFFCTIIGLLGYAGFAESRVFRGFSILSEHARLFSRHWVIGLFIHPIYADELEDLSKQIEELEKARSMSVNATKPLESELNKLDQKITNILAGIKRAEDNLVLLDKSIAQREKDFNIQYTILAQRVESYYKRLRQPSGLFLLLSSQTVSTLTKDLSYRRAVADEDKKIIAKISSDLLKLENDKKRSETEKQTLAVLKAKTDNEAAFFRKEVTGAKEYQAKLSTQIVQLSAKQQQLLAQKLGSLNLPTSLGAGPLYCTDDRKIDPGFRPAFAFFTFGIPHRVGMNQYGAKGRASSQGAEDILKAYFQNFDFTNGVDGRTVVVNGTNEFNQPFNNESMNIEDYLKHIYEMPSSWPENALKAQAISARSYALAEMDAKGFVYPSQKDQVIKKEENADSWKKAVDDTKGKIMTQGGKPIKAWYASTSGGYTFTSGDVWGGDRSWTKRVRDTNGDVGNFSELMDKAYDKESPCFYAAQGFRGEYGKSAWLKSEEVADIVNVLMLAKADGSTQQHLSQVDKPNPDGTDTWDKERVKSELRSRSTTPYNNISDISVDWDKSLGKATRVNVSGDAASNGFDATEFRNYFNLRSPANIQIVGPLFNIEKK